ncbi:MAG TPA: aldo/keto reductase [Ignavibacteria bacterium]|nr:aldo/keto reductase [Ignavibacteria bacterium]
MHNSISIGDIKINRIGLGTNRLTDNESTRKLLQRAIELGINYIDTANIYTKGESEKTIGSTLSPYPEGLVIGTKGGMVPGSPANNEPAYLQRCLEESLTRLKTNCITLYQLHRAAPDIPIEETMKLFAEFKNEGKIKHVGLSEVTVEQIEKARRVTEIVSVQNHFNLSERKHEDVLNYCEENNIIFIPFFPLDKGKISVNILNDLSKKYNVTTHQLALAWLLKRSPVMLPIPGTLSEKHLTENSEALNITISEEDFNSLNILSK